LTDRGKILLAILLVALIFVLPAVILAINAWSGGASPPDNPSHSVDPQESPPGISNGSLPEGSDFTPQDPPESGNGEQGSFDPPIDPVVDPPKYGPINLNLSAGTMLFLFSPELQDAIDEDTVTMIGDFLKSPRNTSNARIAVEMPQIPDDDMTNLISAITSAFSEHDIPLEKLAFAAFQTTSVEESFEVKLLFFVDSYQK